MPIRHTPSIAPAYPLAYLRADSPLRPPDWRYRLAMAMLDAGRQPPPTDAELIAVIELLRHLRQYRARQPLPASLTCYREALAIYVDQDGLERAVLEASLLARRLPEEAAQALRLAPDVARIYATVFFDVTGCLRSDGFTAAYVFRSSRPPEPTLEYVLRAHAWAGGPVALDDLLHAYGLGYLALSPMPWPPDPVRIDLHRRAGIAMLLLPFTRGSVRLRLELSARAERLEAHRHNREHYATAEIAYLKALLHGARRVFGVAVRTNPFLQWLLAP